MLEGLDRIDWAALTHAYGPADDVPHQLRALADPDPDERRVALHDLYGNIWHQGTVYQATAYAVPFLIELLGVEQVEERHELLRLLAHLANGSSYLDVHQHLEVMRAVYPEQHGSPEWQARLEEELSYVHAAAAAVWDGLPRYLELLEHPDPALRIGAAHLLATMGLRDQRIQRALLRCLQDETDADVVAALLLALGTLPDPEVRTDPILLSALRFTADKLVKLAAALGLARALGPATPPPAVLVLVEAIAHPERYAERYALLPWGEADVVADVCQHLRLLGAERARPAIPLLARALSAARGHGALVIADALLALAFGSQRVPVEVPATMLSDGQHAALAAIASADRPWSFKLNMMDLLERYGLPGAREQLRSYLAA